MRILEIRASARKSGSLTRMMADAFVETLKKKGMHLEMKMRDVGLYPPSIITEGWLSAAFSKNGRDNEHHSALQESDDYIDEVHWADTILIATPMYNYGMPASLKAWFDQVIRINKTFTFDLSRGDFPLEPTMKGKVLLVFTSSGEFGFEDGGVRAGHDHLLPHIKTCSRYLGVDVKDAFYHLGIEYQEFGDSRHGESISRAKKTVAELAEELIVHYKLAGRAR